MPDDANSPKYDSNMFRCFTDFSLAASTNGGSARRVRAVTLLATPVSLLPASALLSLAVAVVLGRFGFEDLVRARNETAEDRVVLRSMRQVMLLSTINNLLLRRKSRAGVDASIDLEESIPSTAARTSLNSKKRFPKRLLLVCFVLLLYLVYLTRTSGRILPTSIMSPVLASLDERPPFDITKSRFDVNTYYGRLQHFTSITSPLTLFASSAELARAQQLLVEYQEGRGTGRQAWGREEEAGIWKAKQLVDSSLHPDTGLPVPLPFRLSAFVPTNLVIVGGMLMPNPSLKAVLFWQWANQSLNVCVNYSNANKSIKMSNTEIATAYASATIASCAIAVSLSSLVPRLRGLSPATRGILGKFVPFVAVASAGCVNIGLMRWKEIRDGIAIFPPTTSDGVVSKESLGVSSKAGEIAISQTAASRVLTNIPTLIIPPVIMTLLERRGAFKGPSGNRWSTVTHIGLIGTSLLVCLPPAIATFPQRASIDPKKLEPKFRDLKYSRVEFNKGL